MSVAVLGEYGSAEHHEHGMAVLVSVSVLVMSTLGAADDLQRLPLVSLQMC